MRAYVRVLSLVEGSDLLRVLFSMCSLNLFFKCSIALLKYS